MDRRYSLLVIIYLPVVLIQIAILADPTSISLAICVSERANDVDVTAQLEISEDAWNRMEGIDRTECEEMIRGRARLCNLCTGWFKGKVICSEYHRFKHLLSWCSDGVKT